jgi:hypothetical protein
VLTDDRPGLEAAAVRHKQEAIATRIIAPMSARDREVLMLFHLDGRAAEQIQAEMVVTEMEFRSSSRERRPVLVRRTAVDRPSGGDSQPAREAQLKRRDHRNLPHLLLGRIVRFRPIY